MRHGLRRGGANTRGDQSGQIHPVGADLVDDSRAGHGRDSPAGTGTGDQPPRIVEKGTSPRQPDQWTRVRGQIVTHRYL